MFATNGADTRLAISFISSLDSGASIKTASAPASLKASPRVIASLRPKAWRESVRATMKKSLPRFASIAAKRGSDFFIVARTDSRQALGLSEAITRGLAFKEAGADAVFIEAPESKEEMKEIAKRVSAPLVANMLERGVTPLMGPKELKELGFDLVVWPLAPLYSVAKSLTEV